MKREEYDVFKGCCWFLVTFLKFIINNLIMSWFIMVGAVVGSFAHLILKDGVVKEGEIKAWQNWFVSVVSGVIGTGAYYICVHFNFLPAATDISSAIGLGAFVGYTLDSLFKKIYHKK